MYLIIRRVGAVRAVSLTDHGTHQYDRSATEDAGHSRWHDTAGRTPRDVVRSEVAATDHDIAAVDCSVLTSYARLDDPGFLLETGSR